MFPYSLKKKILADDKFIADLSSSGFKEINYKPKTYYKDIIKNDYYLGLLNLRHYLKLTSDYYFSLVQNAKNIDLFMLTPSISSPMGPGSDSKAISIKFGEYKTCLVDSSQFGLEPILMFKSISKVYCYLPSMRGEDPDKRHLNQFFHLELEMKGKLENLQTIIEEFIKYLCGTLLLMENTLIKMSKDSKKTINKIKIISEAEKFPEITFDEAINLLEKNKKEYLINFTKYGRDIKPRGEIELFKILKLNLPLWIKYYDRSRVPFYQKPLLDNPDKTINADLLFPPLLKGSFGGEIVGSGQRQDDAKEIFESLKRQHISSKNYQWYIDLRNQKNYQITSGFGLGVERFITWALARDNIRDSIFYPRLKNIKTLP